VRATAIENVAVALVDLVSEAIVVEDGDRGIVAARSAQQPLERAIPIACEAAPLHGEILDCNVSE